MPATVAGRGADASRAAGAGQMGGEDGRSPRGVKEDDGLPPFITGNHARCES